MKIESASQFGWDLTLNTFLKINGNKTKSTKVGLELFEKLQIMLMQNSHAAPL
jgi:hypothetical protein